MKKKIGPTTGPTNVTEKNFRNIFRINQVTVSTKIVNIYCYDDQSIFRNTFTPASANGASG